MYDDMKTITTLDTCYHFALKRASKKPTRGHGDGNTPQRTIRKTFGHTLGNIINITIRKLNFAALTSHDSTQEAWSYTCVN